jgi:tRNA (guanine37-N1)-methyltransferase
MIIKISIITVFPQMHETFVKTSLIGRALEKGIVEFNVIKVSDLCQSVERIDEPTCGPGAGMILKPELIKKAIDQCEKKFGNGYKIFFSPQGIVLNQPIVRQLATNLFNFDDEKSHDYSKQTIQKKVVQHVILVCSRYEGMDSRVEERFADLVLSIGDYVVMGGDLPAQIFLESVLRFLPGVVGNEESVQKESFSSSFLDFPEYGLPAEWEDLKIPDIVRSGNHAEIEKWRQHQAIQKTIQNRFDWFISSKPNSKDIELANQFIPNHYVALMHTQIVLKGGRVGHSSVASLDIHDIARSSKTYGIKKFFLVSPLKDQQEIVKSFLRFWNSDEGKNYNRSRFDAIALVEPVFSLDEALDRIEEIENKNPILISTSAKQHSTIQNICYNDHKQVWKNNRPILFVFGTAQGLADEVIDRSDFLLEPLQGLTNYNHLSVRAAVAIIFDRWLGLNPKNKEIL